MFPNIYGKYMLANLFSCLDFNIFGHLWILVFVIPGTELDATEQSRDA